MKNYAEELSKGQWISRCYNYFDPKESRPAAYLRKVFNVEQSIKEAVLYICGLGYNEVYINGQKVGDEVLTPPFTRYDKTVLYNTYDICDYLVEGENVIGVILGNGVYNVQEANAWNYETAPWKHHPKMVLLSEINYEDETKQTIHSDNSWKFSEGPIIFDSLYGGEVYDARLELNGWCNSGYDDALWENAAVCRGPGGRLKPMTMEPCRVVEVIKPIAMWEVKPGVWIFDLGKNISGWVRLRIEGESGDIITIKYAEKLDEGQNIDQSNIITHINENDREHFQKDVYILKGVGEEIWEPRFTDHGFQYVQVTGFQKRPTLDSINGCRVHTDFENRGSFECSNDLLNKIQEACRLSVLGNYHGIPTDCPHREKNGWTGDALISAEQMLLNFDPQKAYYKWLEDIEDAQRESGQIPGIVPTGGWGYNWGSGPAWDSALILIPWYLYIYRGDTDILSRMYESMRKYVDYMTTMVTDNILDFGLGDWCPPVGGPADYKCPSTVTDTAYYYCDADVLSKVAKVLNKEKDSHKYSQLSKDIAMSFNRKFVDDETGEVLGDSQTSYACALYFDLVHGEIKQKAVDHLIREVEKADRHIDCGILGTKYILHVLSAVGRGDLAYAIASQKDFPGWGYWIEQGATTLWETWDGENSRNHHMFSDISAWFYKRLAGINPDPEEPGFKHILIRPNIIEELTWVKAGHESKNGRIEIEWQLENDILCMKIRIPDSCRATLYLPEKFKEKVELDLENSNVEVEFEGGTQ